MYGQGSRFTVSIPVTRAGFSQETGERPSQSSATPGSAYVEEAMRWLADVPPIAAQSPESPALGLDSDTSPIRQLFGSDARILLADDNADMRRYVHSLLAESYIVDAVVDGEAALAAALENPPDLVLSDITRSRAVRYYDARLDGFGLLKALRPSRVPAASR
jgi:hypothetical protein